MKASEQNALRRSLQSIRAADVEAAYASLRQKRALIGFPYNTAASSLLSRAIEEEYPDGVAAMISVPNCHELTRDSTTEGAAQHPAGLQAGIELAVLILTQIVDAQDASLQRDYRQT